MSDPRDKLRVLVGQLREEIAWASRIGFEVTAKPPRIDARALDGDDFEALPVDAGRPEPREEQETRVAAEAEDEAPPAPFEPDTDEPEERVERPRVAPEQARVRNDASLKPWERYLSEDGEVPDRPARGEPRPEPREAPAHAPPQGRREGPPPGPRDVPPQGRREGPPPGPRDMPAQVRREGPPPGPRDVPSQGRREGPPPGPRDMPAQVRREGPPPGPRDMPAQGRREGPPPGPRDMPAQGRREGPPPGPRDMPAQGRPAAGSGRPPVRDEQSAYRDDGPPLEDGPPPWLDAAPPPFGIEEPAPKSDAERLAEARSLDEVREILGPCERCKLCSAGRKQIVFGVGNPRADLMFVGEGPGRQEDQRGEPFVGDAGQLLTRIIEGGMKVRRSDVYIANIVKCRPPQNRDPEPDEVEACEPFLAAQIAQIQPKVIVALGKWAAQTLLRNKTPISRMRGKWQRYQNVDLMPTYHPAYLLRNPAEKRPVWEDVQEVMKRLEQLRGRSR